LFPPAGGGIHGTISTTQKRYPSKPNIEATGAERFLCPSVYFVEGIKELTCITRPSIALTAAIERLIDQGGDRLRGHAQAVTGDSPSLA
jgi:hypothetical protein